MSTGRQHKEPATKAGKLPTLPQVRRKLRTIEGTRTEQLARQNALAILRMKRAGSALVAVFETGNGRDRARVWQILLDSQKRMLARLEELQKEMSDALAFWEGWQKLTPQDKVRYTLATLKIAMQRAQKRVAQANHTNHPGAGNVTQNKGKERKSGHTHATPATSTRQRNPRKATQKR